jgi:A/G-specific adenine glycosylase
VSVPPSDPALDPAVRGELHAVVLGWFARHGRPLNFRRTRDPYAVLVSEVIAQQTQIARVEPAWEAFLARFPTVEALAAASPADVLRQWRGLGYNRRALNLQRAARAIVAEHRGVLPADMDALARLPGIGPYTARAVAAIAFGMPVGAVDTNVRRVLGRVLLGQAEAMADGPLQALADAVVPAGRSAEWTHALMDVGATCCRPRAPRCDDCPLGGLCRFRAESGGMVRWAADAGGGPATGPTQRPTQRPTAPPRAKRPTQRPRFTATSRWLRGRILDLARTATAADWAAIPSPLGSHEEPAIETAISALANEGLLELDPTRRHHVRLPQ